MKFNLKHLGKIEGGKILFNEPKIFNSEVKELEGKNIELILKKHRRYKKRTIDQNAYWHAGICIPMSEENGDTQTYWHKYLKIKFILKRIIGREPDIDKIINYGRFDEIADMLTTTSLSTSEHCNITSEIRSWVSMEYGIYLLTPEEYHEKIYNEK